MKKSIFIMMVVALLCLFGFATPIIFAQGQSGTTLTADVTVAGHWTITYGWTIEKSVMPAEWNLFKGDEGTSQFSIVVTKDNGTEKAWVEGEVCVTNGGDVPTENLAILVELKNGYGPAKEFLISAPVDLSSYPILAPGETKCYLYRVDIPITGGDFPQPHASGNYKVTAHVTITNHSGHLGELFGPSPSADLVFLANPTKIHDEITVNDTNGYSWDFSASGSKSYEETFSCDGDAGLHENTATITYKDDMTTGPYSQANVMVKCYALEVKKDACPSFTRTYNWTIDKMADQSELTLSVGQEFTGVNYSVKVDATFVDSDWAVAGKIWVKNPAPMAAVINSIADVVSPDIAAMVTCGVTFPYTLPAGETLECTYSASLPNADARTNTATATLQNHAYDYQLNAMATGTTNFSGMAAVDFTKATINYVDECIKVTDSYAGELGTVCYENGVPKTFTYSRNIEAYSTCGEYTVENIASFVTNDLGVTGSDSWTIKVHVPCVGGCTLTPGYWKTHSKYGPAPYDENWASLMPLGEDTPFYSSGKTWYEVLWTPPAGGNAYYILAHAYIAAKLNFLNGASSTPEVDAAILWAEKFFTANLPTTKFSKTLGTMAKNYAGLLDQYNNGLIGPGHCSEEMTVALPKEEAPAETDFENLFMESTIAVPTEYALNQNHPNPFNPSTTISFDIPKSSMVHLTIYNIAGQQVATIVNENLNAGHYAYIWNIPADLPSGTYLYKLVTEEFSSVKQMMLVK